MLLASNLGILRISGFRRIVPIVILTGLAHSVQAQRQDAAAWTGIELEKKLKKRLDVHLKTQFRLNENFSNPDYTFADIGIDYSPKKKFIQFTTAWCFNFKNEIADNGWSFRQQWYGNATLIKKFGKVRLANRNQFQSDIEDQRSSEGSWFYRNKTSVRWEFHKKWAAQGSVEGYLRIGPRRPHEDYFYRTRYSFILRRDTGKKQNIEIGYLLQRQIRQRQPDFIHAVLITYSRRIR